MANRFGVLLHPDDVRWAAAEGVSEAIIAAVLLLHERSVKEIAAELSAAELEQVIKLVGRSPRVYAPGTLDALKQRRALVSPEPPQRPSDGGHNNALAHKQHPGAATDPDQMRRAHEHRLAMLRAHTPPSAPEPGSIRLAMLRAHTPPSAPEPDPTTREKPGTRPGTRTETVRRRFEVAQLMKLGLSVRTISMGTGIPPTSVRRAMRAVARAEAKQEVAVLEIMDKMLEKTMRRRAKD